MATGMVEQIALEQAFGALLKVVIYVARTTLKFNSIVNEIKATLINIEPIFYEIQKLNKILDVRKQELDMFTHQLLQGEKLILKCSTIQCWNLYKKYKYTNKLLNLKQSLLNFFQMDVQLLVSRDSKKILVGVDGVDEKVDEILEILKNGDWPMRFSGSCGVPGLPDLVVGLDEPLQELKLMLLKEDASVVVLSAPGGSGKTTLAKKLCRDEQIEELFRDNIFFVNVSQNFSLEGIVHKLFQHMKFPYEFRSDEDAINQLEHLLRRMSPNPILLVLDDVWSQAELIQKFMFQIPHYKILVTSRFEFPRFEHTYKLKLLTDEDAMTLFHHSAFPQKGGSYVSNNVVKEIVKGCKRLPLALTVVGRTLKGKPEVIWRSTLRKWSEGQSILGSNSDLFVCLQTSVDALDEVQILKECYLDLAVFPEDQRIPASVLMDIWVEMYNLDEDGMSCLENLVELSTRNLVNLVLERKDENVFNGYCNGHFITQHDVLRELAIHLSNQEPREQRKRVIVDIRRNNFPKWLTEQFQQPHNARLLSISSDEAFSTSWFSMQLPQVEALIMNFRTREYTLPLFMVGMDQLKVLIVANYGFSMAELSNLELIGCLSNLKRLRLEHVSISSFSMSMLQLMNLKKISLIMCEVRNAFENFTNALMWPNLEEIDIEYCDDLNELPMGVCNIFSVKKLSITRCPELVTIPDELANLKNLEELRLHSCTKLSELPTSIGSLQNLRLLDISDCLSLSTLPMQMGKLSDLRMLHMRGCTGLYELPCTFVDLKLLEDVICDEEMSYLWEPYQIYLTNLSIHVLKKDVNLIWLHHLHC